MQWIFWKGIINFDKFTFFMPFELEGFYLNSSTLRRIGFTSDMIFKNKWHMYFAGINQHEGDSILAVSYEGPSDCIIKSGMNIKLSMGNQFTIVVFSETQLMDFIESLSRRSSEEPKESKEDFNIRNLWQIT